MALFASRNATPFETNGVTSPPITAIWRTRLAAICRTSGDAATNTVCTDGIIAGDFITQEIRIDHADATIVPRRPVQEPLTLELGNFIQAIQGKSELLVSGTDATNVTRVAEAAILSSNTGSPVYLELSK